MPARIYLRAPTAEDQQAFLAASQASRTLHHPWVSAPLTPDQFAAYLERMSAPAHHPFLICRRDNDAMAGVINLSHIVMGAFRSGYLGYYAFADHAGQGLLREGMLAVIRHAFTRLKLHRLEANIQPGNTQSIALAQSCGFRLEGYSPRYLKIAGRWRDHERWAIVAN